MSSQLEMSSNPTLQAAQASPTPPTSANNGGNEDGVSIRPMRLKVLYTFDDQNKTNCLARWPHVLQVQTVAMDESTSIGVIELKTCIDAIIQCSPELVQMKGQDFTIYAYDYSEYDTPLVGQGMLSRALATVSPTPDAPTHQQRQLITGRVCKNILGLFNNGVKETLEVKLRLVPVPTVLQQEYLNTMEKYREMSKGTLANFDPNEWNTFLQANPNMGQPASRASPAPSNASVQRQGMSFEVVNQLLSPSLEQQQSVPESYNQGFVSINSEMVKQNNGNVKGTKTSRPSSRASAKRPRGRKPKATPGGNTSGYEEGTDGDDGPAPKKRAKVTKADWKSNKSLGGASDSLRVAASTAGSLRLFRPIAMSPHPPGGHLQEVPRAATPVPILPNQHLARDREPRQSSLQRDSFSRQYQQGAEQRMSPYLSLGPEDQLRRSIESGNPSPERNDDTPPNIASSPPVMRTRPESPIRSSPPCPSSPVLPQMPRTDSGFMSGSLEDLFGEDEEVLPVPYDEDIQEVSQYQRRRGPRKLPSPVEEFSFTEVIPGPMDLLPTKMPTNENGNRARSAICRAGSVTSEDGSTLPPLRRAGQDRRRSTMSQRENQSPQPAVFETQVSIQIPAGVSESAKFQPIVPPNTQPGTLETTLENQVLFRLETPPTDAHILASASQSRPASRSGMARTASMGSLTFPMIPASDPILPPSALQRSQTWSEVAHPATEATSAMQMGMPMVEPYNTNSVPYSRTLNAKKASIQKKLEAAIANGEMPPYCANCGAIKTSTWRKAWSQEKEGEPGYHEYSDEPGRVTAITILTRDDDNRPTSYKIIKKSLGPEEEKEGWKQYQLCNPCGIWMSKYKTQRPEAHWGKSTDGPEERGSKGGAKRPKQSRPPKSKKTQGSNAPNPTSEANFPYSEMNLPQSEMYFPPSEAHQQYPQMMPKGASPEDATECVQNQAVAPDLETRSQRSGSGAPRKRLNAMTSDSASAALRRAIQSSPARWQPTTQTSAAVEDTLGGTRRLLFPSPRKDGSPKVLGEVVTNSFVTHVASLTTEFRAVKGALTEAPNKENCQPDNADNDDAELLKLFEEELGRPTTPIQKSSEINPFKTPTRPTPSHRPITRSVSKSARTITSPGQLLNFAKTPTRTPRTVRRSPRNRNTSVFESPFTASLHQMMSEANNHTSPMRSGMELDFDGMPDLPHLEHNANIDMNFNLEDFFSTDIPMPSSPPRMAFQLHEDPLSAEGNIRATVNWADFGNGAEKVTADGVVVKAEPGEMQDETDE